MTSAAGPSRLAQLAQQPWQQEQGCIWQQLGLPSLTGRLDPCSDGIRRRPAGSSVSTFDRVQQRCLGHNKLKCRRAGRCAQVGGRLSGETREVQLGQASQNMHPVLSYRCVHCKLLHSSAASTQGSRRSNGSCPAPHLHMVTLAALAAAPAEPQVVFAGTEGDKTVPRRQAVQPAVCQTPLHKQPGW